MPNVKDLRQLRDDIRALRKEIFCEILRNDVEVSRFKLPVRVWHLTFCFKFAFVGRAYFIIK